MKIIHCNCTIHKYVTQKRFYFVQFHLIQHFKIAVMTLSTIPYHTIHILTLILTYSRISTGGRFEHAKLNLGEINQCLYAAVLFSFLHVYGMECYS